MTVDAAAVERWARALGVWADRNIEWVGPVPWRLLKVRGEVLSIVLRERGDRSIPLDPLTAALILIGHARGLRVDVGECPACRHTLTWEAAIIAAMPRPCPNKHCEDGVEVDPGDPDALCVDCDGDGDRSGDADTLEALRVMAHTIAGPEHVAIVGDWCAEHERNTAANFPGEPQGGIGELVTAWLRGGCWWCNGGRRYRVEGLGYVAKCGHCNGHGSVLGGFECELAQAIEAELGRRAA